MLRRSCPAHEGQSQGMNVVATEYITTSCTCLSFSYMGRQCFSVTESCSYYQSCRKISIFFHCLWWHKHIQTPSDRAFPRPRAERLPIPLSDKAPSTEVLQLVVKPNQTTKQIKTEHRLKWVPQLCTHKCHYSPLATKPTSS